MPIDYTKQPYTAVRRADREVCDDEWIRELLERAAVGYLATVHADQPFINSNLFVYSAEKHLIYMHSARVGRTPANLATKQAICFTVSEMGRLLPAAEALEFSVEYAGVVVFGTAEIVIDPLEAEYGLQILLDKYAPHLKPGRDYRPITAAELKRTAVYRITIEQWSGKKKEVADDFPGAFYFEDVISGESI
ncbi:MAG: pyridoxamine 5'-phosphate oxidase family protein [Anaerolineales bacterium]|nr:pyridoxamine 5'-phosphate oxidase family protein [Anaerolineales bacterium]